jgi:hypothetical protein
MVVSAEKQNYERLHSIPATTSCSRIRTCTATTTLLGYTGVGYNVLAALDRSRHHISAFQMKGETETAPPRCRRHEPIYLQRAGHTESGTLVVRTAF